MDEPDVDCAVVEGKAPASACREQALTHARWMQEASATGTAFFMSLFALHGFVLFCNLFLFETTSFEVLLVIQWVVVLAVYAAGQIPYLERVVQPLYLYSIQAALVLISLVAVDVSFSKSEHRGSTLRYLGAVAVLIACTAALALEALPLREEIKRLQALH